jgi:hypothetical protein
MGFKYTRSLMSNTLNLSVLYAHRRRLIENMVRPIIRCYSSHTIPRKYEKINRVVDLY